MGVSFKANMKRIAFLLATAVPVLGQRRETVVKRDLVLAQNEVDYRCGLSKPNTGQKREDDIHHWSASFGICDSVLGLDESAKAISACEHALRLDPEFKAVVY